MAIGAALAEPQPLSQPVSQPHSQFLWNNLLSKRPIETPFLHGSAQGSQVLQALVVQAGSHAGAHLVSQTGAALTLW